MIFFSVSENKAFVLFCQRFIIVKCMDFSGPSALIMLLTIKVIQSHSNDWNLEVKEKRGTKTVLVGQLR